MADPYRIVVLGSGGVGKPALTVQYDLFFLTAKNLDSFRVSFLKNTVCLFLAFPFWSSHSSDPTIEDSYRKTLEVDGNSHVLEILDTAGTEQFTAMRDLYMKNGQVCIFPRLCPHLVSGILDCLLDYC